MGLDQWAVAYKNEKWTILGEEQNVEVRIAEWRKHPNLHGFIENLFRERNPEFSEPFNCVNCELTAADITAIEEAVVNDTLPKTSGFFFGASTPEDKEDDLRFIRVARRYLLEGWNIYYSSWW